MCQDDWPGLDGSRHCASADIATQHNMTLPEPSHLLGFPFRHICVPGNASGIFVPTGSHAGQGGHTMVITPPISASVAGNATLMYPIRPKAACTACISILLLG
ncbi:hypothetical protein J3458_004625 [Metarhizium acridum]|uniref:uncharacterized protein n=1 Tax=Metarhizium acridum TaxID=92637 RepID=UPI001C6A9F3A|nr:hypothetical protein J3458_004625 [Metarhizium acridum]